jgi:DNA-binding NarL/FixJ family response regulator
MSAPTIVIAEDHPMFREALAMTVRRLMPEAAVIEVAGHAELEQTMLRNDVKLVLLDLQIPGARGLSSLVFLRAEYPNARVAIISAGAFTDFIARARQLGASAFIPKSAPIATISQALLHVISGGEWFPQAAGFLPERAEPDSRLHQQFATLTSQQSKVLKYLADGLLNKQIADALRVSEGTVRAHVTAVLEKLQVSTRTQAVILLTDFNARREGLEC